MSSSPVRLAPFVLLFLLAALLLCHSWYGPDIWYHLTWGRGVIEFGNIWPEQQTLLVQPVDANVYWIFQGLMYLTYKFGGLYSVSALFVLLWFAIAVLWLRLSQSLAQPGLGPWLFFAFIICSQTRFEHRPEIFSYLFILLFAQWFLKRETSPAGWPQLLLLFALQALWTNTHGYFALGVLIALAWLTAGVVRSPRQVGQIRLGLLAVGATVLGSLASPAGIGSWISVWSNARVGTLLRDLNSELFAPTLWPLYWPFTVFWLVWALMILLIGRALWKRENLFAAFLGLGGAALSMNAVRNIPLLFLLGAPLLAALPVWNVPRRALILNSFICCALILIVCGRAATGEYQKDMGSLGTFGIHLEWASYPIGAVEFLKSKDFRGKVFTDSYDGGYAEFHLPGAKVAGDSYFSSPELTREYFSAIKDPAAFLRFDQRFAFDALILNVENLEIMDMTLTSPDWTLVYSDSHRALFFRRALYPQPGIKLAQSTYYRGENLANWVYAFGPISWSAIGRKHHDRALLKKIAEDVGSSSTVPSTLVKMILAFAVDNYDRDLVHAAQALRPKTYEAEAGDAQVLIELDARARRCCQ